MQLIVERDTLAPALDAVAKVASSRGKIPILSHILLEAGGDVLRMSAHRLDYWMQIQIKAEVGKAGAAAVPVDVFRTIIRGISAGAQISLEMKKERLELKAGRSKYKIGTLSALDFPAMDSEPAGKCGVYKLSGADAKTLLERPAFAASTDDTRYCLQGVFLHARDARLRSIATDGRRMFGVSVPLPEHSGNMPQQGAYEGAIIPSAAVDGIVRALESGGQLAIDEHKFIAIGPRITFGGKYVDGVFPEYERAIPPRQQGPRGVMDRTELMEAVRRLAAVAGKANQEIRISWKQDAEELCLNSVNVDKGEGEEFVRLKEPASSDYSGEWRAELITQQAAALTSEYVELVHDWRHAGGWLADPNDADTVSVVMATRPAKAEGGR